ncbi:MAG TPA: FAD-dependent oxidoreductase [Tepidisphaeraceae bacterium]|jgi:3-phenylpropionate/trans-cinnamate dioxygenase ferredoxin reductase subunit|nr:FAD-dependent oxidoreductase [Tepidisphaeraceae bacterium]
MSAPHFKYILVGGGIASSAAAQAIRALDTEGSVLLIGQEVNRPYHRPPLSKEYLQGKRSQKEIFTLPDQWFIQHQVELRTGRRASLLDTSRGMVALDNGEEIAFDKLLIATGASPNHLKIPGADLPNVFYLRSLTDADRLHNAIEKAQREGRPHAQSVAGPGRGRVAVIGGGLLGVELAATFSQMGLAVDLLIGASDPWHKFAGEITGRFIGKYLETLSVRIHPQTTPLRLEGDGRVQRVIISDQKSIDCDFVVPAIGASANKDLLRGTTIAAEKAILVDDRCRTNAPNIYAAGDCAAILDPLFGKYRILDHWDSAQALGNVAGRNMVGVEEHYSGANYFFSDVKDIALSAWGESRQVTRHILRGSPTLEHPNFLEFGLTSDGRISQVLAINHRTEDETLRDLVARRIKVDGNESLIRDPLSNLQTLLA